MTGELTAYEGKYAPMLAPWTITAPADLKQYSSADFTGYADVNERDGFYTTRLRINKVDFETGEYILHDNAIFALYAGSRYNTFEEIEEDAKLIDDAAERAAFLATDITPAAKGLGKSLKTTLHRFEKDAVINEILDIIELSNRKKI